MVVDPLKQIIYPLFDRWKEMVKDVIVIIYDGIEKSHVIFSQIISNSVWFDGIKPCLKALDNTDYSRSNPSEPISPHPVMQYYI